MRSAKRCLWVFTGCLFLAGPALAANKMSRPCTKGDVVGVWEMTSVKPILDKTDAVFFPNQRVMFNRNSSMKSISSEKPLTKEWLDKFQKQAADIDYNLSDKGLLTMTWQSRPHSETAVCAYVLSDVPQEIVAKIPPEQRGHLPKKGNITLSYLGPDGKVSYGKIYKKIG